LGIAHIFYTHLACNMKTNDSSNGKNHRKYSRPAVAVFNVFGKGRVADAR
jgi:hypothetical protein